MSKKFIFIIIGIVAVVLVGFFVLRQSRPAPPEQPTVEAPSASDKYITEPKSIKLGKIPESAEIIYHIGGVVPGAGPGSFIYVMDRNGGGVTQITFENPRNWEHAAVSYDRRYIAANQVGTGALWLFDLEKGTEARLVPDFHSAGGGGVDWDPEGYIYFAAQEKNPEPKTPPKTPEEAQALFQAAIGSNDIYRIKFDGTGLKRLTNTLDVAEADVSVSSDGSLIAYAKAVGIFTPNEHSEVWV